MAAPDHDGAVGRTTSSARLASIPAPLLAAFSTGSASDGCGARLPALPAGRSPARGPYRCVVDTAMDGHACLRRGLGTPPDRQIRRGCRRDRFAVVLGACPRPDL